jgi:hypothetical protein
MNWDPACASLPVLGAEGTIPEEGGELKARFPACFHGDRNETQGRV